MYKSINIQTFLGENLRMYGGKLTHLWGKTYALLGENLRISGGKLTHLAPLSKAYSFVLYE